MNILTVFTSIAGVITLFVLLLNEFKKATPPISYHLHIDKQSMTLFLKFGRLENRPYQIKKLTSGGLKAPKIIGYKITIAYHFLSKLFKDNLILLLNLYLNKR